MRGKLDDTVLDAVFRDARSYNGYTDQPVAEAEPELGAPELRPHREAPAES